MYTSLVLRNTLCEAFAVALAVVELCHAIASSLYDSCIVFIVHVYDSFACTLFHKSALASTSIINL